uniref:Expressed sequence AA986860 n=1 Tax=Jaculus jaculus TaxID=51337 RepID=A0A8C5KHY6_JACJA
MPKRELWSAGPGSEPVTCISSWDSMMSTAHSESSDNSYDFLSAEEKECLLFLEETIGSLDAEADSRLSIDESEPAATTSQGFQALPLTQQAPQEKPEDIIIQQGPEPRRVAQSSDPPKSPGLSLRSGSYSLPRNLHLGRSQNLRRSPTQTNGHTSEASVGLLPEPEKAQGSQSTEPHQAVGSPRGAPLDLDTVLIPPPEAFQDIQPKQGGEDSLSTEPRELSHTLQLHTPVRAQEREGVSPEAMSHKTCQKDWTESPQPPQPPPAQSSRNARAEETPLSGSGDKPNAQLAPLTAAKPRRLPPNIVLKSSRSSFHSHPQNRLSRQAEASDPGPVSSSLQEQRKARREALEKLGLPQDQDDPSLHVGKYAGSLRLKEAHGQGPSQAQTSAQPAAPGPVSVAVPAAEKIPAPATKSSSGKVWIRAQEPPPGKVATAKSMPIPIPKASKANNSLTQPKLDLGLTLQESSIPGLRQINFKSNTLERSGVGLSSYLSASETQPISQASTSLGKDSLLDKKSPNFLRNTRPRPASLGMGKDFAVVQLGKLADLEQGQNSKRLSYQGQSHDKLPRPSCVSVKISPKGVPDEHRREALKKLGLLKE